MSRDNETDYDTFLKKKGGAPVPYYALGVVIAVVKELRHTVTALQQRIGELEATSTRFEGVHQRDKAYGQGAAVVRQGGLWIALRATCGTTPGGADKGDRDWQLAVKRGSV